ncbi:MAG: uracil-DNA glycosylase [Chloroflexi bacterium]|jgi:uracil-DNA glycosylase family 4|nr:uracil-DNA glycosylase [Anaerolineaceae bacterium]NLI43963.1 uracil-DNA glycosylase [Chloroflexota bacterium]HQH58172.1 uracil-DNA glycosylase [Anaerolineaceae bacterium]
MSEGVDFGNRECLEQVTARLIQCRACPRLTAWRESVAAEKRRAFRDQQYWGKPVPGFGDPNARLLAVGLAPGAHGSNRTGRMFTGDASGDFLYPALFRAGFANSPRAEGPDDGLSLRDLYITAVCRCAPPGNKPAPEEIRACQDWLQAEMDCLEKLQGIVVLGKIALEGVLALPMYAGLRRKELPFGYGAFYAPEGLPWLLCSYHPSRQNTQTGRLTAEMFDAIWQRARLQLRQPS